jgi:pre-mRNA cleavage complex 2 protein Pcf11
MVAEDHAESATSARAIYSVIRHRLLSTSRDNLLPLVYLIDSILKNVKGQYIAAVEKDAQAWMSTVHGQLTTAQQAKLQRVFQTWSDARIFTPESLKIMGRCFDQRTSGRAIGSNVTTVAGIHRTSDGTLLLAAPLKREMQAVLDELQSGTQDELEKVSLERLAELNPDLLASIKSTAEDNMAVVNSHGNSHNMSLSKSNQPAFLQDMRSPEELQLEQDWAKLSWDKPKTMQVVDKLQYKPSPDVDILYTQAEALQMTVYLAAGQALAAVLESTWNRLEQNEEHHQRQNALQLRQEATTNHRSMIDKALFTNDGVKHKNETAIGLLYQMGLPFVSSSDGRRFATQMELSRHLDALFKRSQLEKTMARTEERGWCVAESIWTRQEAEVDDAQQPTTSTTDTTNYVNAEQPGDIFPADEARDRCVICGINFKMFFDNDNGMYVYRNCREVTLENDDAAEEETSQVLVHTTCWNALGAPEMLTLDQALQETLMHA